VKIAGTEDGSGTSHTPCAAGKRSLQSRRVCQVRVADVFIIT
jgi:hypothetical protein